MTTPTATSSPGNPEPARVPSLWKAGRLPAPHQPVFSRPLFSSGASLPGASSPTAAPVLQLPETTPTDAETVQQMRTRLRQSGLRDEAALQWLTDCILAHTEASGVAIALDEGEGMVCCASSGIAPALAVRIDPNSGLSGECLRTGKVIRCDDTAKDSRVDSQVCLSLNLRSVLVVPLYRGESLSGILEWFSSNADPFDEKTLSLLYAFAQLAGEITGSQPVVDAVPTALKAAAGGQPEPVPRNKASFIALAASVVAAAAIAATLGVHTHPPTPVTTATAQLQNPPASVQNPSSQTASAQAGATVRQKSEKTKLSDSLQRAALRETVVPDERHVEPARSAPNQDRSDSVKWTIPKTTSSLRLPEPVAPAPLQLSSAQPPAMPEFVVSTPAIVPQAGRPDENEVVTGGRVLSRVDPVYPEIARQFKRQGAVVVAGVVNQQGVLHNLRVVSGDPMLSPAALAAAGRWRFEPYRMGNQAIEKEITITFRFKL